MANSSQKAITCILPDNKAMGRTAQKYCQDILFALARHSRIQMYSQINPSWTQGKEDYWVSRYIDWCHCRTCREPLAAHCNDEHCFLEDKCLRLCDPLHEHELGYAVDNTSREARSAIPQQLRLVIFPLRSKNCSGNRAQCLNPKDTSSIVQDSSLFPNWHQIIDHPGDFQL